MCAVIYVVVRFVCAQALSPVVLVKMLCTLFISLGGNDVSSQSDAIDALTSLSSS